MATNTGNANHAITGSGGNYCCHCASPVGDAVKVHPVNCDGKIYCPRCFCWVRMNEPDDNGPQDGQKRFNASQTCAAKCLSFCGYTTLCFGAEPGKGLRCSQCGMGGAQKIPLDSSYFTKFEREAIADANETVLKKAREKL